MNNTNSRNNRKINNNVFIYLGLFVLVAIWFVPILTVFLASIKSQPDLYSGMGLFDLPEKIHWQNYIDAWRIGKLGIYMRNGLFVSLVKVPLGIFVEAMAAFALPIPEITSRRLSFLYIGKGFSPYSFRDIPITNGFASIIVAMTIDIKGFFSTWPSPQGSVSPFCPCLPKIK